MLTLHYIFPSLFVSSLSAQLFHMPEQAAYDPARPGNLHENAFASSYLTGFMSSG